MVAANIVGAGSPRPPAGSDYHYESVKEMTETENADWEKFVAELQLEVIRQEEALYSAAVLREAREPQNLGRLPDADAQAAVTGPCGDTMEYSLKLANGRIAELRFMTDGCGPSLACGSRLGRMALGMRPAEAAAIAPETLLAALDGLPESHQHCATLAVDTLRAALRELLERSKAAGGGER